MVVNISVPRLMRPAKVNVVVWFVCSCHGHWSVSPRMDLNKRQYDLGWPDRWEYPTYFDIKAGMSWSTLEIHS